MLSARAVFAACRAIAVACFIAAVLTPAPFLTGVELSLLGLLIAIVIAAAWRRRITAPHPTSPSPAFRRLLSRGRPWRADSERHQS
jgi:hypothetical protein